MPTMPGLSRTTPAATHVPRDFAELYRQYFVYVVRQVVKAGSPYQEAEDIAQTILVTFYAKGALDDYRPTYESKYDGRTHKAVFRTFLNGFVLAYVRHYIHRERKLREREGKSCDVEVKTSATSETGELSTWIEVYGPTFEESYHDLYDGEFMDNVRARLADADTGRKDNKLDLVAFFNAVARQVEEDGKYSTTALMEEFGVTRTTIHNWLARLRTEMSVVVG